MRGTRRNGQELFGFFAANDRDLSAYLNSLPRDERALLVATMEAALSAPATERFERRLYELMIDGYATRTGSEEERRYQALIRMLGYEYQQRTRRSISNLADAAYAQFLRLTVEDGKDPFFEEEEEEEEDAIAVDAAPRSPRRNEPLRSARDLPAPPAPRAVSARSREETAAEWLLSEIEEEGRRAGSPLTDADLRLMRTSVTSLSPDNRQAMLDLNNRVVLLARRRMDAKKAAGAPCSKPRRGLRIPTDWLESYQTIFVSDFPWVVSAILQNAMMANTPGGERRPWRSP